jgi:hypothetical protein
MFMEFHMSINDQEYSLADKDGIGKDVLCMALMTGYQSVSEEEI